MKKSNKTLRMVGGGIGIILLIIVIGALVKPQTVVFAIANRDRIARQAALLYRVQDELLGTTAGGQHYIDLFYENTQEITTILYNNPGLDEHGLDAVDEMTPGLQALLDGRGSTVIVTAGQVGRIEAVLDEILPYAGPKLQQAIADERRRRPLEPMIGMTMDQAWAYLNGGQ